MSKRSKASRRLLKVYLADRLVRERKRKVPA